MDQSGGTSHNLESPAPVPNASQASPTVPSFVCVLPCIKPSVKYLDRLDGCASGLHATLEDTQDLQVLYDRMGDAIAAYEDQSVGEATAKKCAICLTPIVPSLTTPVLYMENCAHFSHYHCLRDWIQTRDQRYAAGCPECRAVSSRFLIWPQVFATEAHKTELFQLQKSGFGLSVAPKTVLHVKTNVFDGFPLVKVTFNRDNTVMLMKRQENPQPRRQPAVIRLAQAPRVPRQAYVRSDHELTEPRLVQLIQDLHLADQARAFHLGDILPLEENGPYQANYGPTPVLSDVKKREKLLLQFWCPYERREDRSCVKGQACPFFHFWPENTPAFIQERVKVRQFPGLFCLVNSRLPGMSSVRCNVRIRPDCRELVRCSSGFHPTTQDLQNMDVFAHKMAKHIMTPMVVPEPEPPTCAFCRKRDEPNSVWIHMANCVHTLLVRCVPLVRHNYAHLNRRLDLHCPACQVASVRTIAWPGPFPSQAIKHTILGRQLRGFQLLVHGDVQLSIVQVANRQNVFTVDFGWTRVFTIDAKKGRPQPRLPLTIFYD